MSNLTAHIPVGKRVLSYDEEYGIAVYYAAGIPIKDISERFGGISRSAINRVVTRLGVETDRGKRSNRNR